MFISAELKLKGSDNSIKVYQLDFEFLQSTDKFGRPAGDVLGGKINMLMQTIDDPEILMWALGRNLRKSGEIIVQDVHEKKRTIKFEDALCTYYQESFDDNDKSDRPMITRITLQMSKLLIEGKTLWEVKVNSDSDQS